MANESKPTSWMKRIQGNLDILDNNLDNLYKTTYSSRSDNQKDREQIVSDIELKIGNIINNNGDGLRLFDMSSLYNRIQKKGVSNAAVVTSAMELFNDSSIVNNLTVSQDLMRFVYAEDYQYDLICRYMPSIETALSIKKDNVLSADNFTKDFLSVESNSTDKIKSGLFNDRANRIISKYKFQDICEEMYSRAAKYGECFLYVVPYNIAIERLLKRRAGMNQNGLINSIAESANTTTTLLEASDFSSSGELADVAKEYRLNTNDLSDLQINLIFDDSGILSEAIEEKEQSLKLDKLSRSKSLNESYSAMYENALAEANGDKDKIKFGSVYTDKYKSGLDGGVNDGLIVDSSDADTNIKNMNGCVVSFIERGDILPIYMDNLCIGYYHFAFSNNDLNMCRHGFGYGTTAFGATSVTTAYENPVMANDTLLRLIAQRLSTNLDAHFINANKDLKEEIYAILKYNDQMNAITSMSNIIVSFLPASDVYHFFLQQDKLTHRGISSIRKALVPAMLYCLLYLTTVIGQITRGQDKRVYYVKQTVDSNVSKTLMNVINQIKKGNMGMRQIESMNNILNIIGKYNDHVIPEGPNGETPIRFEVMEGQRIETPSELMERFQNDAVESTDVPYEFTQSVNQVDYATRFTMSNSKFLRKVYKEQRICKEAFSSIFTKIYNYEYGENERQINIMLPAPAYLSMVNTAELVNNTANYINAIIENEYNSENDNIKDSIKRLMFRNMLGTYIDYNTLDNIYEVAKMSSSLNSNNDEE